MKVLIVGGGVAGLTVGSLLSRTGSHEVTVLERAAGYGDVGYGIGLYPLGGAVFHALGAAEELRRRSTTLTTYAVHGPDGTLLQSVDLAALLADFGPMLGVTRRDLIDVLARGLPPGAIRFGAAARRVRPDGDTVVVDTEDGRTFTGDVLVAADGMHSAIRESLFGSVPLHDTGWDAWMWWAPTQCCPPGTAAEYWGPSAFVGTYPMPHAANVAVGVPRELSPDPDAGPDAVLAALRRVVTDHNPGAADLPGLWRIVDGVPFRWRLQDVRAPRLTALDGRVTLLGDSGIGFLPTAGVGASNALRSAAALAYELSLADAATVAPATTRWQTRVEKLVTANQTDSRQLGKLMNTRHATTSKFINAAMKHLPVTLTTRSIVTSMTVPF